MSIIINILLLIMCLLSVTVGYIGLAVAGEYKRELEEYENRIKNFGGCVHSDNTVPADNDDNGVQ